eukprot:TRINITY_DN3007_c0_g1_i1.p2 TRINITY_DN3007_c0_g1~~TRINITY_DN3007_c0_g1_i1.p2  ORF type:complete len:202 (-),score=55.69 TRINITY_DN3007_c0_g1_i1:1079-1684(-)
MSDTPYQLTKQDILNYNSLFTTGQTYINTQDPLTTDDESFYPIKTLYNILTEETIKKLIRNFYTKIFQDDEAEWFREAFEETSGFERHILMQSSFWIEAMGGGSRYPGGKREIDLRHSRIQVEEIMTEEGADRWLYHMRHAMDDVLVQEEMKEGVDVRKVRKGIGLFLLWTMKKYAYEFDFEVKDLDWRGFGFDDDLDLYF